VSTPNAEEGLQLTRPLQGSYICRTVLLGGDVGSAFEAKILQLPHRFVSNWHVFSLGATLTKFSGWMTTVGWQALVASTAYISGTLIQALVVLTIPSYEPQRWHGTLIIWAVLLWGVFINTTARRLLPRLEGPVLCVHILGFFGVLVPLVVLSSHRESSDVWGAFVNEGGWSTQGLSTMIGLLMSIFLFTGVDGAIHVCNLLRPFLAHNCY
jgi:hypothetical protein